MSTEPETDLKVRPRERILTAALELFVQQGYFNTNVPDISRHSKCSVGSIYHHFINKEEIAGQLYREGINRFRDVIASAINPTNSLEANIRQIVIAFLTFAEQNLLLSRYLWLSRHTEFLNSELSHPTMVGFDSLGRKLTRAIKNGVRAGEIAKLPAEIYWSIVFGIPLSFVRDWLDGFTSNSPSEVSGTLANACWEALHGVKKPI